MNIDQSVEARGTKMIRAHCIDGLVATPKRPRLEMLMIKDLNPVDCIIEPLLQHKQWAISSVTGTLTTRIPSCQPRILNLRRKSEWL